LKTPQKSYLKEKNEIIEYFKKAFILVRNNSNDPIYFSTLINLVFCLIIKENYSEAVFYLKLNKSKETSNLNIIRNYLIQCYIYLNKIDLAKKKSEEIILDDKSFKMKNTEIKYYERLNSTLVSVKGLKLSMLINLIKLCVMNKKIKEMQKYLLSIMDTINFNISVDEKGKIITNEEMPSYIINVFVYYYLLINRKDLALDILKNRKIKEILITSDIK
jgi:tetratricopeptide (TPR) repeat protein